MFLNIIIPEKKAVLLISDNIPIKKDLIDVTDIVIDFYDKLISIKHYIPLQASCRFNLY